MKRWANIISTISLSVAMALLVAGCGKKVTSSSGDTASERIKPEAIATVPPDQSSSPSSPSSPSSSGGLTSPGGMDSSRSTPFGDSPSSGQSPSSSLSPSGGGMAGATGGGAISSELQDIYFDYDRFTVRTDGVPAMEQNARWLRAHKGDKILIEGHCDERGTQAYNLVLGEKRARSAKRYLEDLGVPGSQLQIVSYGENRPFCKEQTETCYQKNRRAHFAAK